MEIFCPGRIFIPVFTIDVKTSGNTTNLSFHIQRYHPDVEIATTVRSTTSKRMTKSTSSTMVADSTDHKSEESDTENLMPIVSSSSGLTIRKSTNKQIKLDLAFESQRSLQGN